MENSDQFEELRSELVESGSIRPKNEKFKLLQETTEVKVLCEELSEKMQESKELSRVKLPRNATHEWLLLGNTPYPFTVKSAQYTKGLRGLCCRVIVEASLDILESRKALLQRSTAMNLRLSLWLEINQWLSWNPSGLERQFKYWDRVPDQIPEGSPTVLYNGEKAAKIQKLFAEDLERLGALGNFLTSCPALSNNPNSPAKDRVITLEMKGAIDCLLEVRKFALRIAKTATDEIIPPRRHEQEWTSKGF
jgi:hypothetical protein